MGVDAEFSRKHLWSKELLPFPRVGEETGVG
jgi:hypothetical protein